MPPRIQDGSRFKWGPLDAQAWGRLQLQSVFHIWRCQCRWCLLSGLLQWWLLSRTGPGSGPPQEIAPDASFIDDEAFKRLQGKRNRGREEINFVEIKGDDQLSGAQQWMTKSLTEEKTMKSFSKRKVSSQQASSGGNTRSHT